MTDVISYIQYASSFASMALDFRVARSSIVIAMLVNQ